MSTRAEFLETPSVPVTAHFKRRFAAWSLAVLGALSTTGVVCLQPPAAWGYDDPATTEKKDDAAKPASEEAFSREVFSKLLAAGKIDEAASKLDAAIAESPADSQLMNMELQLASMLSRSNPEEAKKRMAGLSAKLLARDEFELPMAMLLVQATSMRVQSDRNMPYEEKIIILDEAIAKLSKSDEESPALKMLLQYKIRAMVMAEKTAEAKSLLDVMVEQTRANVDAAKPATIMAYSSSVVLYNSSLSENFPAEAKAVVDQADTLLQARLTAEDATAQDYAAYSNMKLSLASALLYADAKQCAAVITDVEKVIAAAKERFDETAVQPLGAMERSLKSMKSSLEKALLREELIGTQAPEISAEHFVASQPLTMEDLRGKVVLLDFWAVWCGPCIATFPHLIEWHEKYADKGLVILGATSFYNYKWDDETSTAVSVGKSTEVAPEEELAMLEKFRESHKLQHPFFVNPKGSDYATAFAVSGIPQAVVLDKDGKIQLIRVGSGDANAKAIEAKIEELLAL